MTRRRCFTWPLLWYLLGYGQICSAAWNSWFHIDSGLGIDHQSPSNDLTFSQRIFEDANRALSTLEEARLCKRDATLKLISTPSCKDLLQETSREDIEVIQDLYAVELSRCEIESASVKLPSACHFDIPSIGLESASRISLQSNLRSCLAVLHSKPQWWTSYSNHRRDGYQWCLVMKPGFDHNENVKVWKNVYTALDVSISAIKESLSGIHTWSRESRETLNELSAFFTRMMDLVQSAAERGVVNLESRFAQSADIVQARMSDLSANLVATESTMNDIEIVTQSSRSGIEAIHDNVASLDRAQHTQIERAGQMNAELQLLQDMARHHQNNITVEQATIMETFTQMRQSSEQLGQSFLDANDNMQHLNVALSALSGISGVWNLLSWVIPVVLVSLFNRKVAAGLALLFLLYQEMSSYLPGLSMGFGVLRNSVQLLFSSTTVSHIVRIMAIVATLWYFLGKPTLLKKRSESLPTLLPALLPGSYYEKYTLQPFQMVNLSQRRRSPSDPIAPLYGCQESYTYQNYHSRSFRESTAPP